MNALVRIEIILLLFFLSKVISQGVPCDPKDEKSCANLPNEVCARSGVYHECECKEDFIRNVASRKFFCERIETKFTYLIFLPKMKYDKAFKNTGSEKYMKFQAQNLWFEMLNYLVNNKVSMLTIDLIYLKKWDKASDKNVILKVATYLNGEMEEKHLRTLIQKFLDSKSLGPFKNGVILPNTGSLRACFEKELGKRCSQDKTCNLSTGLCECKQGTSINESNGFCQGKAINMSFVAALPNLPVESDLLELGSGILELEIKEMGQSVKFRDTILFSVVPAYRGVVIEIIVTLKERLSTSDLRNELEAGIRNSSNKAFKDMIIFKIKEMPMVCSNSLCFEDQKCHLNNGRKTCVCLNNMIANSYSGECKKIDHIYEVITDFNMPYMSKYVDLNSEKSLTLKTAIEMETFGALAIKDPKIHAVHVDVILPGSRGTVIRTLIYSDENYLHNEMMRLFIDSIRESRSNSLYKSSKILKIKKVESDKCSMRNDTCDKMQKNMKCSLTFKGIAKCQCKKGYIKNSLKKACEIPHFSFHSTMLLQIPWSPLFEDIYIDYYLIFSKIIEKQLFSSIIREEKNAISVQIESIIPSSFFTIDNHFFIFIGYRVYFNKYSKINKDTFEDITRKFLLRSSRNKIFKNGHLMTLKGPSKICYNEKSRNVCDEDMTCSIEDKCVCKLGQEMNHSNSKCTDINAQYQLVFTLDVPHLTLYAIYGSPHFETLASIVESDLNGYLASIGSYINSQVETIVPMGDNNIIVGVILSFSKKLASTRVIQTLEESIKESMKIRLLSNAEILLIDAPPRYCTAATLPDECEVELYKECAKDSLTSEYGKCVCKTGYTEEIFNKNCAKVKYSLILRIDSIIKYSPDLTNKETLGYKTFKKAIDIIIFDKLFSVDQNIISVSLTNLEFFQEENKDKAFYTIKVFLKNKPKTMQYMNGLKTFIESQKNPLFNNAKIISKREHRHFIETTAKRVTTTRSPKTKSTATRTTTTKLENINMKSKVLKASKKPVLNFKTKATTKTTQNTLLLPKPVKKVVLKKAEVIRKLDLNKNKERLRKNQIELKKLREKVLKFRKTSPAVVKTTPQTRPPTTTRRRKKIGNRKSTLSTSTHQAETKRPFIRKSTEKVSIRASTRKYIVKGIRTSTTRRSTTTRAPLVKEKKKKKRPIKIRYKQSRKEEKKDVKKEKEKNKTVVSKRPKVKIFKMYEKKERVIPVFNIKNMNTTMVKEGYKKKKKILERTDERQKYSSGSQKKDTSKKGKPFSLQKKPPLITKESPKPKTKVDFEVKILNVDKKFDISNSISQSQVKNLKSSAFPAFRFSFLLSHMVPLTFFLLGVM